MTISSRLTLLQFSGFALGLAAAVALSPSVARADHGDCGQPQSAGKSPASSDALVILKDSVGVSPCGNEDDDCDCDVNDSGDVTPMDSLIVLRKAVGFSATLSCHDGCQSPGTTIPGQTTTTLADDDNGDDGNGATSTTLEGDDGQGDHQGDDGENEDDGNTLGDD